MKKTSGQVKPVTKPFVKGNPTDERTFKSALGFMGVMIMTAFISFLVCTMINPTNTVLRVLLNLQLRRKRPQNITLILMESIPS